jgi:hypothetical protein
MYEPPLQSVYRVIQEESAILWEMIVCVILSKKVHINMCPIFDGYGVRAFFNSRTRSHVNRGGLSCALPADSPTQL